ncbi:TPA: hypothetical protein NGU72_004503 [Vibrio parahaemolyticus]|nr:hypothetical protein [Vibrio parahaemolyticus]
MYLNTRIKSHHHVLTDSAFELFSQDRYSFQISQVTEDAFTLSIKSVEGEEKEAFVARSHSIISFYLVALNVATMGHFSWDFQMVSPVPYFYSEKPDELQNYLMLHKGTDYLYDEEKMDISSELVWRSLKIMLALASEKDDVFISEYIKGIYSLHNNFFNIKFTVESLASFYRAFEYFCTVKVLKQKRLNNEKKQLKAILADFGFNDLILEDFDRIYKVRCTEVMHAQRQLAEQVDVDLIIRLKIFLDALLHKHYEPIWDKSAS